MEAININSNLERFTLLRILEPSKTSELICRDVRKTLDVHSYYIYHYRCYEATLKKKKKNRTRAAALVNDHVLFMVATFFRRPSSSAGQFYNLSRRPLQRFIRKKKNGRKRHSPL